MEYHTRTVDQCQDGFSCLENSKWISVKMDFPVLKTVHKSSFKQVYVASYNWYNCSKVYTTN